MKASLVNESMRKNQTTYFCEVCEFGYRDIGTAEARGQYCNIHGYSSLDIHKRPAHRPVEPVLSIAA